MENLCESAEKWEGRLQNGKRAVINIQFFGSVLVDSWGENTVNIYDVSDAQECYMLIASIPGCSEHHRTAAAIADFFGGSVGSVPICYREIVPMGPVIFIAGIELFVPGIFGQKLFNALRFHSAQEYPGSPFFGTR